MSILASFTIANNAGVALSIVNAVQALVQAAIDAWSAVLSGNSTSRVTITFAEIVPSGRVQGGNEASVPIGTFEGSNVFEPGTAYELRTGLEHTHSGADIHITIAREYLLNGLYLDTTLETAGDIPNDRVDAYSVFLHEIGHAIGFIGYYNEENDSFSYNANTPYDTRLMLRGSEVFFDGPNVREIYGDAVPLTNDNYTHYGNTRAYPGGSSDLLTGMMNGMVYYSGYRYSISALDLAIMADNGVGTIQNDRFSVNFMKAFNGGSGTDTVDFLSATSAIVFSLALPGAQATGGLDTVTLVGIENLIGSAHGDTLSGDDAVNTLSGGDGDDLLSGGGSSDALHGDAGADVLQGGAGNDLLIGGAGADTFRDTSTGLNGDTIRDFSVGDRIVITDASLAGFAASIADGKLTFTGGSINLDSGRYGDLSFAAAAGGGVQLQVATWSPTARNDFNGDGRSDILWRSAGGTVTNWLGQANGGFVANGSFSVAVGNDWTIVGTGDVNGDGRSDILWRNASGTATTWLGQASGGFVSNIGSFFQPVGNEWKVVGVGDVNGDGRDDIIWRNDGGTTTSWLGQASGGFLSNAGVFSQAVGTDWKVAGVGDVNGDGRDDLVWRAANGTATTWLGQANGGFVSNAANFNQPVGHDWQVAGVGDFNGDGRDDLVWRNANGTTTSWLGQANGGFVSNAGVFSQPVGNDWSIADIGDFNGDGRDDILWRNANGTTTNWLGQANGGFVSNAGVFSSGVGAEWQVQNYEYLLL